jgi:hypothetical protein
LIIISVIEKKGKYNRNIIDRGKKLLKKKKKKEFNNRRYSDNDIDVHSNFSVGKAIAMTISFEMIKNVKTMDITSDLTNSSQLSIIIEKILKWFSVYQNNIDSQKLFLFWWKFVLIALIAITLYLILMIIWSSVKWMINIGTRLFTQRCFNWWTKIILAFYIIERKWLIIKKFKYSEDNLNKGNNNLALHILLLIERKRFHKVSLSYSIKRTLLIRWF